MKKNTDLHGRTRTNKDAKPNYLKRFGFVVAWLGLALMVTWLAGCASTGSSGASPSQDPEAEAAAVRQETAEWTELVALGLLIKEPRAGIAMQKGVAFLNEMEAGGGVLSLDSAEALLAKLDELQSPEARLALLGGKKLIRRLVGDLATAPPPMARAIGLGLRDGMQRALGQPASAGATR